EFLLVNCDNVEGENGSLTAILSRLGVQVRAKCSAVSNVPKRDRQPLKKTPKGHIPLCGSVN
ncbi:MAG: hypothetical protein ABI865_13635, partial [Nitrosospira sp.]